MARSENKFMAAKVKVADHLQNTQQKKLRSKYIF